MSTASTRPSDIVIHKDWFIQSRLGKLTDYYNLNMSTDFIGEGAFAKVVKATTKDGGIPRAVKIIKKDRISKKDKEQFRDEIEILKAMDHPNIIKLIETFEDNENVYVVTELCTGGEMFDRIISSGSFTESEARRVFTEMLQALNYLHSHGICHKDLKPENFLYLDKRPESQITLIDFGFAERFIDKSQKDKTGHKMTAKVGTAYYIAPEVIEGNYDQACDLWSAGTILYIMLSGYPPFNGRTDFQIMNSVKKGYYDFKADEWKKVSDSAKHLISSLLAKPDKRLTAEQALQHPWILSKPKLGEQPLNINYTSLKNFVGAQRFKKVALTAIASRLSESEISELSNQFKKIDKNGDGVLTLEELKEGLKGVNDKNAYDIRAILDGIDTDHNGTVDYTEFIAATMETNLYMRSDKLKDAFQVFDRDGNGKITAEELQSVLEKEGGSKHDIGYYKDMIREVDKNGDGMVDYSEFMTMMQHPSA